MVFKKLANPLNQLSTCHLKSLYNVHGWKEVAHVQCGLVNIQNTSFVNAVIQCLFHIPAVVDWLQKKSSYLERCSRYECMTCELIRLYNKMTKNSIVCPSDLLTLLEGVSEKVFNSHDAADLLRIMLSVLDYEQQQEEFGSHYKGNTFPSSMQSIFSGTLKFQDKFTEDGDRVSISLQLNPTLTLGLGVDKYKLIGGIFHDGNSLQHGCFSTAVSCPDGSFHNFSDATIKYVPHYTFYSSPDYRKNSHLIFYELQLESVSNNAVNNIKISLPSAVCNNVDTAPPKKKRRKCIIDKCSPKPAVVASPANSPWKLKVLMSVLLAIMQTGK